MINEERKQMTIQTWQKAEARTFWEEIAHADHLVQVYDSKEILIETLTGFAGTGINAGDAIIIIAKSENLAMLCDKLISHGININSLIAEDKFIPINADEALATFMRNGMPDETLFNSMANQLYSRAIKNSHKVRAYGEMVATLCSEGNTEAMLALENLWSAFCRKNALLLYCAYPKNLFNGDSKEQIHSICSCHTKEINGNELDMNKVIYKEARK
ncbi:MAG TPA: MEDS domain-containing protein [Flavobacteriales bacterium]|nr:MEDS domain-containing protein [Flavobacteriales bacterium]